MVHKVRDIDTGRFLNAAGLSVFSPSGNFFTKIETARKQLADALEHRTLHGEVSNLEIVAFEIIEHSIVT